MMATPSRSIVARNSAGELSDVRRHEAGGPVEAFPTPLAAEGSQQAAHFAMSARWRTLSRRIRAELTAASPAIIANAPPRSMADGSSPKNRKAKRPVKTTCNGKNAVTSDGLEYLFAYAWAP